MFDLFCILGNHLPRVSARISAWPGAQDESLYFYTWRFDL